MMTVQDVALAISCIALGVAIGTVICMYGR